MTVPASSTKSISAARCLLRGASYLAAYVVFGTLTSAIAAAFGMFFILVALGGLIGVLGVVIPFVPLIALPVGFVLSIPVSFIVLPLLALLLRTRPATHLLASAVGGMATGAYVTLVWVSTHPFPKIGDGTIYIVTGGAAGLVAGMAYAAMVRNTRK